MNKSSQKQSEALIRRQTAGKGQKQATTELLTEPHPLTRFQQIWGNQATLRLLGSGKIQTKAKDESECCECKTQLSRFQNDIPYSGENLLSSYQASVQNQSALKSQIMRGGDKKKQQAATSFRQQVFIVRDPEIGLGPGANLVANLTLFKRSVMKLKNPGEWSLVLAIHGSEDRLAAQSGPDWKKNAIFYYAQDFENIFAKDPEWVEWRDKFGPNHLVLAACQVSIQFEKTIISALTRHAMGTGSQSSKPTQRAQGLGHGCFPSSTSQGLITAAKVPLKSRHQFEKLTPEEQESHLDILRKLNQEFGYYGAPPVPKEQILDYFFNEYPKAQWVIVQVATKNKDNEVIGSSIPFWNRATGLKASEFRRLCSQGVGNLGTHQPSAPRASRPIP